MTLHSIIDAARLAARYAALLVAGAAIYALYLDSTLNQAPPEVRQFWRWSWLALVVLNLISFRAPQDEPSGASMVALAGLIGAGYLALNYQTITDLVIGSAIILSVMAGFFLLRRLEQRFRGQIDEARFGADGKPLGPWQPPKN